MKLNRYSDVVTAGLILPHKALYTMRDVKRLMLASLFRPVSGQTLTLKTALWIVQCSAAYHDTDYSQGISRAKRNS